MLRNAQKTEIRKKAARHKPYNIFLRANGLDVVDLFAISVTTRRFHYEAKNLVTSTRRQANKSHRPPRKREKIFGRFKSHRQAQRFLSAQDQINLTFRPRRFQLTANSYRHARADAFSLWAEYTIEMVA
jgi:hypothetical protein